MRVASTQFRPVHAIEAADSAQFIIRHIELNALG
jgi:hypothetical protein